MTDATASGPEAGEADRRNLLEWAGWGALAVLTAVTLLLALFHPTTPGQLVNEIRLAAGVDRYQAAMNEGARLYATGASELRIVGSDPEARVPIYRMFAESVRHFETARREAEGFYEDQRAQNALADVYYVWARALHEDGTGPWYKPNDRPTLRRARELVDEGLALPGISGDRRARLEDLGKKIDRAITPWPIL